MFERSEQFELTLAIDQAFQDLSVALGNPSRATVTIEELEGTLAGMLLRVLLPVAVCRASARHKPLLLCSLCPL